MERRRRYRRYPTRRQQMLLLLWGICLLLVTVVAVAAIHLKPILTTMATSRVSNAVSHTVTDAVNECVESGVISYEQLISLEKDNEGRVVAVKSNMAEFSRLQALVLDDIYTRISEVSNRDLSIPVGTLTGVSLLAGRGPAIRVRIQSVGAASAHFENYFIDAGINQTKHQIVLHIDVSTSIFLPGYVTAAKVSNQYTVAETIIVGDVPGTYTYFNSADAEIAADYILNQGE